MKIHEIKSLIWASLSINTMNLVIVEWNNISGYRKISRSH